MGIQVFVCVCVCACVWVYVCVVDACASKTKPQICRCFLFFSLINSKLMNTYTHTQGNKLTYILRWRKHTHTHTHIHTTFHTHMYTHTHTHTHTHTVGASIRRHLPHKGQRGLRAAATTAAAVHYGTQRMGMGVQCVHHCLPVCVSVCFFSESCGLISPAGPSMLLLSLMYKRMHIWTCTHTLTHTCALPLVSYRFLVKPWRHESTVALKTHSKERGVCTCTTTTNNCSYIPYRPLMFEYRPHRTFM